MLVGSFSPVLREYWSANSSFLQDGVVTLPEPSEEVRVFLAIISNRAGSVEAFASNFRTSIRLYKMSKKYAFESCPALWINTLLLRYLEEHPLETFAVACEQKSIDVPLAIECIKNFVKQPSASSMHGAAYDPSEWSDHFIEKCGLVAYSSYVKAYNKHQIARLYKESYTPTTPTIEVMTSVAKDFRKGCHNAAKPKA
jgi:hypothetical protein